MLQVWSSPFECRSWHSYRWGSFSFAGSGPMGCGGGKLQLLIDVLADAIAAGQCGGGRRGGRALWTHVYRWTTASSAGASSVYPQHQLVVVVWGVLGARLVRTACKLQFVKNCKSHLLKLVKSLFTWFFKRSSFFSRENQLEINLLHENVKEFSTAFPGFSLLFRGVFVLQNWNLFHFFLYGNINY